MERDREPSSDSSSWSLVDVNDSDVSEPYPQKFYHRIGFQGTDASDIDSVGDEIIMESVHDSDSESEFSDDGDGAEPLSEAEEATEESDIDEPLEVEEPLEVDAESDESDDESDEEEAVIEEKEEEDNELESSETVEVVEEEEVLAEAAAKHFVEPAKLVTKFEELCKF